MNNTLKNLTYIWDNLNSLGDRYIPLSVKSTMQDIEMMKAA